MPSLRQRKSKRTAVWFLALILFSATVAISFSRIGYGLAQPPRTGPVDAIVVLDGDNPRRIMHGIVLYRQGLAPELWHTGNQALPEKTTSSTRVTFRAQLAAQLAIEQGVPPSAIHLLSSDSTWEDGQSIAALARQRQVHSILVVTNWSHSRRALCVIQHHLAGSGVSVYYDPPASDYGPGDWWRNEQGRGLVLEELVKIGFYGLRYGLLAWRC